MIQGIILDIMISVYFIAIALNTPAGESALLVQVHPILTLILGTLILHERMDKNKIISLLIAFLGIIILIRPWEGDSIFTHVVGDFFALCNGIFYSFYLIIGRSTKEKRINISPLLSIGFVMVWTFICYIPMLFVFTTIPLDPIINRFTFSTYNDLFVIIFGIGLGLLGSVLPYGLIMIASRHVESSRQAILLLGEPLGAIIFGFLILSEPITIYYIIGGGLLLFAIIYLTIIGSKPSTKASILIEEN
jgi:drug/metabolite transporter (DMT)-like permease